MSDGESVLNITMNTYGANQYGTNESSVRLSKNHIAEESKEFDLKKVIVFNQEKQIVKFLLNHLIENHHFWKTGNAS